MSTASSCPASFRFFTVTFRVADLEFEVDPVA